MPGRFGQVHLAVQKSVKVGRGVSEVHADDAVLGLADSPTVLPLDGGGLGAFLDETGLVQKAHGSRVGVVAGDTLLKAVADSPLVPPEEAQELLEGARRRTGGVGDRLDALALQGAELPLDIGVQMATRRTLPEAAVKFVQVPCQGRLDPQNRLGIHDKGLPGTIHRQSHRLAA